MQSPSPTKTHTDRTIDTAVRAKLQWTPDLDASSIVVLVGDSTATLTGVVGTYSELLAVDRITRRVRGVTSASNYGTVVPAGSRWLTDLETRSLRGPGGGPPSLTKSRFRRPSVGVRTVARIPTEVVG
ncbi:BON domain-containing protein [Nesterenkonia sp. LB17]|uniref:BON domain-containing protein n=1 Tax=Nesterenkonia sp. LB17 TaxID=2901230 RepID=UPI00351D7AB2